MADIGTVRLEIPCNIDDDQSGISVKDLVSFLANLDQNMPVWWDSRDNRKLILVAPVPGSSLFICEQFLFGENLYEAS